MGRRRFVLSLDFFLTLGLLVADFVFIYRLFYPSSELNPYMVRDIRRTQELLRGHLIWVGPDTTQGGYTPGPFFYYLLAPLVAISSRYDMIVIAMIFLRSLSLLGLSWGLAVVAPASMSFFFACLSSSVFLMTPFLWANNSTFIVLLLPILLWAMKRFVGASGDFKSAALLLLSVLIGCFAQVHLSFLTLVPLVMMLIVWENQGIRYAFKCSWLVAGAIGVTMAPYFIAWFLSVVLNASDGPIFHEFYSNLSAFSHNFYGKIQALAHSGELWNNLGWEIFELWATYVIFAGRCFVWGATRRRCSPLSELDILRAFTFLLMICSTIFVFSTVAPIRYNYIWFFLAWMSLILDLAAKTGRQAQIVIGVLLFTVGRGYLTLIEWRDQGVSQDNPIVSIADREAFCRYFNSQGIGFDEFRSHAYEVMSYRNEASFAAIDDCFESKSRSGNRSDKHFLIVGNRVLSRHSLPGLIGEMPVELRGLYLRALDRRALKLKLTSARFRLYEFEDDENPSADGTWHSNLAFAYQLDAGMPLSRQLFEISKSAPFDDDRAPVTISAASLCSTKLYCDIYVFSQLQNGEPRFLFISRAFQTKFMLNPFFGRLEDLELQYDCDHVRRTARVASRLGVLDNWQQNSTFFTPTFLKIPETCNNVVVRALHVARQTTSTLATPGVVKEDQTYPLNRVILP